VVSKYGRKLVNQQARLTQRVRSPCEKGMSAGKREGTNAAKKRKVSPGIWDIYKDEFSGSGERSTQTVKGERNHRSRKEKELIGDKGGSISHAHQKGRRGYQDGTKKRRACTKNRLWRYHGINRASQPQRDHLTGTLNRERSVLFDEARYFLLFPRRSHSDEAGSEEMRISLHHMNERT